MTWDAILASEVDVDSPADADLFGKIKGNLDHLYGLIGGLGNLDVYNGGFEIDSDSDGTPDGWTINTYQGGTATHEAVGGLQGKYAMKFSHPGGSGNGGGEAISDYVPVSEYEKYLIAWLGDVSSAATGIHVKVDVLCYDDDKVVVAGSPVNLYDNQTDNPTSPTRFISGFVPPTGTRWIKIKLMGGLTDKDQVGNVTFDDVRLLRSWPDTMWGSFSLTEQTTTSGTFVDAGSAQTITLPFWLENVPVMLVFPCEMANSSSTGQAVARWILDGTGYVHDIWHDPVGYTTHQAIGKHTPSGKTISAQAQLRRSGTDGTSYLKKLSTYVGIHLLQPE